MPRTSLHSALSPLHCASVLFGLAPVSWYTERRGCLHAALRHLKRFWSVSLTSALLPLLIYSMSVGYPRNGNISRIVGFAASHVPLYSSGLITLLAIQTAKRRKVRQLVQAISRVDRVMVGRGIGLSMYRDTSSRIVLQLLLVFVMVVSLWVLDLHNYCRLNCYSGYSGLVPFLVNTVQIIQFLNFVLILRKKYELLNECLTSSLSVPRRDADTKILAGSPAVNLIPNKIFEVKPSGTSSKWNTNNESGLEVYELRDIYRHLYDISHLISATYGVSLLGITAWLATYSVACVVFALRHFSHGKYPVAIILLCVLSLCFLAAITVPCGMTTDEANRSSVLVQKLLLRRDISERSTRELDRFYTQLSSMGVKFTACGFFSLDTPMLFGIVGAICTNVIVISQLK